MSTLSTGGPQPSGHPEAWWISVASAEGSGVRWWTDPVRPPCRIHFTSERSAYRIRLYEGALSVRDTLNCTGYWLYKVEYFRMENLDSCILYSYLLV